VVLLHGQPGSSADWDLVTDDLARDHRVIVPDRLGYGRTGGQAGGFAANANAVVTLLDALGVPRAVVVGHSWAGGIGIALALDFPGRVAGLVLVSSVAPVGPTARLDRLLAAPLLGPLLAATTLSTAGEVLSFGPTRAFAGWRLGGHTKPQLVDLARSWKRRSTWQSFVVEQRALVHELPSFESQLSSIRVPTAVLVGSADRVVPAASGTQLADRIPGATLEIVTGGHLLPQLQAAAVASTVRRLAGRAP
jgi:pimeloyl-ACP methyl ester carboxylesterase